MKKILSVLCVLSLLTLSLSVPAFAKEKSSWGGDDGETLKKHEIKYLIDKIGLTEEELGDFPNDVLRELIDNKAKKVASNHKVVVSAEA